MSPTLSEKWNADKVHLYAEKLVHFACRPVAGVDLHLELPPGEGLRQGLESALRSAVRSGVLAAGSRLPATRVLAAELGISRGTVSAAYDQLVAEGYLLARHGSGTTVAPVPGLARRQASRPAAMTRHDLRPGTPDVTAFPVAEWLRSARRALNGAPAMAFGYGPDGRGRPELRAALADYLGRPAGRPRARSGSSSPPGTPRP